MLRALLPLLAAAALSAADAPPDGDAQEQPLVSLDSPRTTAELVESLTQIGQRHLADHRDAVDAALDAKEPAVQVAALRAVRALGSAGDGERAKVRGLIASTNAGVRVAAIRAAAGDREATPAIADALADPAASAVAHDALVRLARGSDLGFDPAAWKAWLDKRAAASADAAAALRQRLSSPDHAEVLAALASVAVVDLDADTKRAVVAPLRTDPDPAIASVANEVWTSAAGKNAATAAAPAPAAIIAPAPAKIAAPVVALVRRKLAAGDIASLAGLALVMLGGTAGVLWALYRTSRKMTRAFTAAIAVKLKPKNVIKQITEAIRNPRAVVKQVTTAIRNPRRVAKSITEAIRRPKAKAKAPAPAPTEDREVAPAITEAIAKAHK